MTTSTETTIRPFSGSNYHTNADRYGNAQPCVLCGKHVKKPAMFARVVDGGGRFASTAEDEATMADDMGWYAVGPECKKLLGSTVMTSADAR